MRFMRRVSVGLIVLAPRPCEPGIIEARLLPPEDGVVPRVPMRGERAAIERRFVSAAPTLGVRFV